MRAGSDVCAERLELQALYSIPALARFARVNAYTLRRVLRANGIAFVREGRSLLVPLTEIRRKIPPLWDSLCAMEEARRSTRRKKGAREK